MKKGVNAPSDDSGAPAFGGAARAKAAPPASADGHSERRMSKDSRKSQEQQERIFQAIAKVMARESSATITMDTIAERIGGSKGTVYYYFKSKGEMLYRMQMYAYTLIAEAVYPTMDDKSVPPLPRLEQVLRAYVAVLCKHWLLMGVVVTDYALKEAPVGLARVAKRTRATFNRRMSELIDETMAAEGWTCADARTVTALMVGLVTNFARWYKRVGRLSPEQMADLLVQYAIHGPFDKKLDLEESMIGPEVALPDDDPSRDIDLDPVVAGTG